MKAPEWFYGLRLHHYYDWWENDHYLILQCRLCGLNHYWAISQDTPTPMQIIPEAIAHILDQHKGEMRCASDHTK